MTVTTGGPDVAVVVRALSDANVRFVVVGESGPGQPLRLVVSGHPTNLDALGRALDRLESTVRTPRADVGVAGAVGARGEAHDGAPRRSGGPRRVSDPMGTISVSTSGGDVDLLFGGSRRSLYAEVALHAEERVVGGQRVQWTGELPAPEPLGATTSRMLGQRLLSLAEGLVHLVERQGGDPPRDAGPGADG